MNFDLSEEQQAVRDLAAQVLEGEATTERVKAAEHGEGIDRALWQSLADAGLLALALPEEHGGSGLGPVELALVLQQQGRRVAPVPLLPTLLTAAAIAEHGTAAQRAAMLPSVATGATVLSTALVEPGANDPLRPTVSARREGGGWRLSGWKPSVPWGAVADVVLVPALRADGSVILALVDVHGPGVRRPPRAPPPAHEPQAHLELDVLVDDADVLGGEELDGDAALLWIFERALAGLAAIQVGVAEGALALTAEHISTRVQFGKPLAAFQAVTQRAADGYITTEAMRVTALNAAWRLGEGLDARRDVLVAAYWATEGAQDVVLAAQHLHGGVGADVDYPVHRYFLWGTQLGIVLGSASAQLARLGRLMAAT